MLTKWLNSLPEGVLTDLDVETDMLADVLELKHDDGQTDAEYLKRIARTRDER